MGFRLPGIVHAKKILQKYPFDGPQWAKMTLEGYVADYVGENCRAQNAESSALNNYRKIKDTIIYVVR